MPSSAGAAETANGAVERIVLLGLIAYGLIKRMAFGNMKFRLAQFGL